MRGHGSLQALLGKWVATPKRNRDSEEEERQGVKKPPRVEPSASKPPKPAPQPAWDWKSNKPAAKPQHAPDSQAQNGATGQLAAVEARLLGSGWTVMHCMLAGLRHRSGVNAQLLTSLAAEGTELSICRDPSNPVDSNAMTCMVPPSALQPAQHANSGALSSEAGAAAGAAVGRGGLLLGHVPAPISKLLAPLLDGGQVEVKGFIAPQAAAAERTHQNRQLRDSVPCPGLPGTSGVVLAGNDGSTQPAFGPLVPSAVQQQAQPTSLTLRQSEPHQYVMEDGTMVIDLTASPDRPALATHRHTDRREACAAGHCSSARDSQALATCAEAPSTIPAPATATQPQALMCTISTRGVTSANAMLTAPQPADLFNQIAAPTSGAQAGMAVPLRRTSSGGAGAPPRPPQHLQPSAGRSAKGPATWPLLLCVRPTRTPGPGGAAEVGARITEAKEAAAAVMTARDAGGVLCDKFVLMLQALVDQDAHLFSPEEMSFMASMAGLPRSALALLLRLTLRRGPWFAVQELMYTEVQDVEGSVDALCLTGLLLGPGRGDCGFLLPLMPQQKALEVCSMFKVVELQSGARRAELDAALVTCCTCCTRTAQQRMMERAAAAGGGTPIQQEASVAAPPMGVSCRPASTAPACPLLQRLLAVLGPCVRIAPAVSQLVRRMQRVYLLSESLDLSRFLATERGVVKYPPYTINRTRPVFDSRQELLAYEDALTAAAELDAHLQAGDLMQAEACCACAWDAVRAGLHKSVTWPSDTLQPPIDEEADEVQIIEAGRSLQLAPSLGIHGQDPAATGVLEATSNQSAKTTGELPVMDATSAVDPMPPKPLFLARFCAAWVYVGMATVGVSLLEKARKYGDAIAGLRMLLDGKCCPGRRGEWWTRLSIDLEHTGDEEGALCAAEASLKDPWVKHGDKLALQRRVLRLGKPPRRWKKPGWAAAANWEPPESVITARPLGPQPAHRGGTPAAEGGPAQGSRVRFYSSGGSGQQVHVEELALEHYASEEGGRWCGVHAEGGIWATLFGLLMWDVLFGPGVPDVFRTPFQTAPLDLDTDAFYHARREQIDARLQAIACGEAGTLLAATWAAHYGTWARGINWERASRVLAGPQVLVELQEICRCVGGLGLSAVCRLLAEDNAGARGGMPDLLLWRPAKGDAKLVEVKSARDRLSDAQRAWAAALVNVGVQVEVLRVQDPVPATGQGGAAGKAGAKRKA